MTEQTGQTRVPWRIWLVLMLLPYLHLEAEPNRLQRLSSVGYQTQLTILPSQEILRSFGLQANPLRLAEPQFGSLPPYALLNSYRYSQAVKQKNTALHAVAAEQFSNFLGAFVPRAPPSVLV